MIESPCILNCTLDRNDVCVGCGRTIDEIIGWTKLTDAERRMIMERIVQSRP